MNPIYTAHGAESIYMRMVKAGKSAKIYYFDEKSGTLGMTFLLLDQPQVFGTYEQFKSDCAAGTLPDYSFIEPNYTDHAGKGGQLIASDQHPDHNVFAGEAFIAEVYENIRSNQQLWESTLLLIVYDEHGGTYDHVVPPAIAPHGYTDATTGFQFDRLGVRVPAVLVSPWIPPGSVIDTLFEHASIPGTVTRQFIGDPATNSTSPREQNAASFLDVLSLPEIRTDRLRFQLGNAGLGMAANPDSVPLGLAAAAAKPASNPSRLISQLIKDHLRDLQALEQRLAPAQQTHINVDAITTENQASEYIAQVMSRLGKQVGQ
jgi:phospholipase C